MSDDNDTPSGDEAADTTLSSDTDDTLQADSAADTTVAGEGADTIAGEAVDAVADDAVGLPDEPGPSTPTEPGPTSQLPPESPQIKLEPDDLERDFDAAIAAVDQDDVLTVGQKAAERVRLKAEKNRHTRDRQRDVQAAEENARNAEARRLGVSRAVFDAKWGEACDEAHKQGLGLDAAKLLLRQKVAGQKKPAAAATPPKKKLPAVVTTATGARLSPPGGAGPSRDLKPKLSAEDTFDQGNWVVPGGPPN